MTKKSIDPPIAKSNARRALSLALVAGLATACAGVGPDFKQPAPPEATGYTREAAAQAGTNKTPPNAPQPVTVQTLGPGEHVRSDWWRVFSSERLDHLVARALENNPGLAAAEATLRQARELYRAQAGSTLYPTVTGQFGASRRKSNPASYGQPSGRTNLYSLYNAGIRVNYNLDLFGANRRSLEALAAQADYQAFELAGARLALAGNVVTTAIAGAALREQIAATQAIVAAQQAQLDIATRRYQLGAAAQTDVLSLTTQLEQTRAGLPPLENRLDQTDHLLAVLIGAAPALADVPRFSLADFTLPGTLPLIVPSELVRQRPDIQASTALLHAATAKYDVAVSELFPQIDLSATLETQALTADALFGPGTFIWNLAGQLAQPLFNGGLRAGAKAVKASVEAAGAQYRQTVLAALQNVADVLRQLDHDGEALAAQMAADGAAQESLALVRHQYKLGASSYLQLLTAEQQAQQTRIALISAQAARLADSAALYQALGGGVLSGPPGADAATSQK